MNAFNNALSTLGLLHHLISALVLVGSVFLIYLTQLWRKHRRLPPGPLCLPFKGNAISPVNLLTTLNDMKNKYGDIFTAKIGPRRVVVLATMEAINEVFEKQGNNFTNLPKGESVFYFASYKKGNSLFVSEGEIWKKQRCFLMSNIEEIVFRKPWMEECIQSEAQRAVRDLHTSNGTPYDLVQSGLIHRMATNVISALVFGQQYDYEDQDFKDLTGNLDNFMLELTKVTNNLAVKFPFLRFLPDSITGLGRVRCFRERCYDIMKKKVREHEERFDPGKIRDLIDVYLKEMKSNPKAAPPFTTKHLLCNMVMLFQGGIDEVAAMFARLLISAARHPDEQKKVQEEIDSVVGRDRQPSWMNKNSMPYVEAFCLETQRAAAIFPLTMMHSSKEDCAVMGYKLPAGTHVIGNLWSVYHDTRLWDDPEKFRPKRFIDDDGKVNQMRHHIKLFSVGKRTCPGESLASMEIFIFFTTILQNFTLTLPDAASKKSDKLEKSGVASMESYSLCAVTRSRFGR